MKKYHILLSSDENYIMQATVSMNSIIVNNSNLDLVFHIIHSRISEESVKMITEWIERTYPSVSIIFHKIHDDEYIFPVKPGDAVSVETYFRILAPEILSGDISKLLYVDCDTVTDGNLLELLETDIDDVAAACYKGDADEMRKKNLGLAAEDQYFQAGVMLMNLSYWREHNLSQKVLSFIKENPNILPRWDQDALNAVLKGQYLLINQKWNTCLGGSVSAPRHKEFEDVPVVFHYTGFHQLKPWWKNTKSEWQDVWLKYKVGTPFEKTELKWFVQTKDRDLYEFNIKEERVKGSKVILYGAGAVGTDFYEQNKREKYCEIVAWVDKNFERYTNSVYKIESVDAISGYAYTKVLVAVKNEGLAKEIQNELLMIGVPHESMLWLKLKK